MTSNTEIKVYGYRWIILLLFMSLNIIIQMLWISFAAVTSVAMVFYSVDEMGIYLLSMTFMVVYIPVTFLSAWIIDKYDFKKGTIVGAILTGGFGFLRIFSTNNYPVVLISQIGVAVAQPFILNSITKMSANWFPENERTTATGISLISVFIGTALGLFATPFIVNAVNFQAMLNTYGIISLIIGIIYTIFIRNRPPTPPSEKIETEKVFMLEGFKNLVKNINFWILAIIFFIGLGIFNTILTYIESIVQPRGFDITFAGILGGLILLGGMVGALVMSLLSDKYKKRKILLLISVIIASVSLYGIAFAYSDILLWILGFTFGFGLVSASPVGLEFAVDLTSPVPEATSNGFLMMMGQISGIIFIISLEDFTMPITNDYFPALLLQAILLTVSFVLLLFIKEKKAKD